MAGCFRESLCTFIVIQTLLVKSQKAGPYIQVYPRLNETDERAPIYFALMLSFGGDYVSVGALPGVQIALDYINSEPSLLPGYTLHYTLTDSQCNRSIALESLFNQLNSEPVKVGWVGSGCSVATEPTAEITQFFNIPQVSCVSSSSELKNRQRFRYYFQLLAAESQIAQGFIKIIENFGWKKVGIVIQNENLFTITMDVLKQKLVDIDVEFTEKLFKTQDGIEGISAEIFDPETRIYVVAMYASHARDFLCKAYKEGIRYPKYLLITYGWYDNEWWKAGATSSDYTCTAAERSSALAYSLAPRVQESYTSLTAEDASGLSAAEYIARYSEIIKEDFNQEINLVNLIPDYSEPFYYAQHCHEATLAFAYALNKTIAGGMKFSIENFQYNDSILVEEMVRYLQSTYFTGLSGNTVKFDEDGIREIDVVVIYQYQWNGSELLRVTLGNVRGDNVEYASPFSADNPGMWPDGIPNDGNPIPEVVTVALGLTVVYLILAVAGVVFATVCLVFTLVFRKRKLIRLSSPNLNLIIGVGAIILYLNVISFVIPSTDPDTVSVLCNLNPWLTSLGYSLCYGTILVKTIRVWFIFNKPQVSVAMFSAMIKDYVLALLVLCLVVIDLIILGSYTAIEGIRDQLGVKLTANKENREDITGSTFVIHRYYLYICESKGHVVLFTVLFGYKALLQITALVLALCTHKVKVKGLDDSKYITASIYVTSIVLVVTTVSYALIDYVNVYPAVVGLGLLVGTTVILGLVFVSRMVGLYRDPEGKNVHIMNTRPHIVSSWEQGQSTDAEIRTLRRRILDLERRNSQIESVNSISNPDNMVSSPPSTNNQLRGEQYHQLHICASSSSHDSSRDNPLVDGRRSVVRWSHDLSVQSSA